MKKVTILLILFTVISHVNAQFFSGTENTTSTIHRTGKIGIGTSNPQMELHISDTDRAGIQIGGPSTSTGAVGDISFRPSDYGSVNGSKLWNFMFRTDTWSGNAGDFVIGSSDGSTWTQPLILQADGDVILADGASAGRKGNVGIGTLNPTMKLDVNGHINFSGNLYQNGILVNFTTGGGSSLWTQNGSNLYYNSGNVGIGTTTPLSILDVYIGQSTSTYPSTTARGDLIHFLRADNNGIELGNARSRNERKAWILARHNDLSYGKYYSTLHLQPDVSDKSAYRGVAIGFPASTHAPIGAHLIVDGNVGIGTTNPTEKLTVNGNILAERVEIIHDVPNSDYVFEPDYNLRSLKEVEQFVKENKHLPEVPSAAEFKENGYSVGTMDDILLRKVEELTLYIIAQQNEMDKQQQIIETLLHEVESLKTK